MLPQMRQIQRFAWEEHEMQWEFEGEGREREEEDEEPGVGRASWVWE